MKMRKKQLRRMNMKNIGVIGAGSWGTALATVVAGKGNNVKIWDINEAHLKSMEENRENVSYLPGVPLAENIEIAYTVKEALEQADVVLFSAPAQHKMYNQLRSKSYGQPVYIRKSSRRTVFNIVHQYHSRDGHHLELPNHTKWQLPLERT